MCELALKAPEDVALVGYDDMQTAGLPGIDLTTVSQKFSKLGSKVMDQLVAKINNESCGPTEHVLFNPALVIRKSCGFKARGEGYMISESRDAKREQLAN